MQTGHALLCEMQSRCEPNKESLCFSLFTVPPSKPKVFDASGQEVRLKLGPYKIGEDVVLRCEAEGGHPSPKVNKIYWHI